VREMKGERGKRFERRTVREEKGERGER